MPEVILINPSERGILQEAGDRPPLGLLYMAKELERHGHSTEVIDLNHDNEDIAILKMSRDKPRMIGVSCLTTPMVQISKDLLLRLRNASDKSRLVVGGYHPSVRPEDFRGLVDNVVIGEGEYGVECLVDGVNGFEMKTLPANIDALGSPLRSKLDMSKYNMQMDGMRTATMMTSRGCPNSCSFCGNPNKEVRKHKLSDLEVELDEIKDYGYDAVYMMDDVFTVDQTRAYQIGKMLQAREMPYRVTTRANYLKGDMVERLRETGCHMVSLGVESGNAEVLNRIGKNQGLWDIERAVKRLGDNNIATKGFFILGLPGDTMGTMRETIDFAEKLRGYGLTSADFYNLAPYPGTPIAENPGAYGIDILSTDYKDLTQIGDHIPCVPKGVSKEELTGLLQEARSKW